MTGQYKTVEYFVLKQLVVAAWTIMNYTHILHYVMVFDKRQPVILYQCGFQWSCSSTIIRCIQLNLLFTSIIEDGRRNLPPSSTCFYFTGRRALRLRALKPKKLLAYRKRERVNYDKCVARHACYMIFVSCFQCFVICEKEIWMGGSINHSHNNLSVIIIYFTSIFLLPK